MVIDNPPHFKRVTIVRCNLSLMTAIVCDCRSFSDNIVVCGGIFNKYIAANLLEYLTVKNRDVLEFESEFECCRNPTVRQIYRLVVCMSRCGPSVCVWSVGCPDIRGGRSTQWGDWQVFPWHAGAAQWYHVWDPCTRGQVQASHSLAMIWYIQSVSQCLCALQSV